MLVDRRVGAAPRRAGERERAHAMALAAHEQLRARRDQRRVAAPDAEHEARRELLAQHAEHRRRVIRRAARAPALRARARSSPARPRAISSTARATAASKCSGRHRAGHLKAPGRRRVEQRQRPLAQLAHARAQAREQLLGGVVGRGQRRQRQAHARRPPRSTRRSVDLGDDQRRRREALPVRRRAAVGREREAAHRDRPAAVGPVARRRRRPRAADSARQRSATLVEALGAARLQRDRLAQPGQRRAAAVGLLEREPRLAGAARGARDRRRVDVARRAPATIDASVCVPLRRRAQHSAARRRAGQALARRPASARSGEREPVPSTR